jgi:hypothetical protein
MRTYLFFISPVSTSLVAMGVFAFACGGSTSNVGSGPGASSSSGGSSSSSGDPVDRPECDASAATGVEVSSDDLTGFPPYAVAGCTLAYVNRSGALVVRDLGTKEEKEIAPASEKPRRPAASIAAVAWEATIAGKDVVRVRIGTDVRTIEGNFTAAREPRVNSTNVVFTAWLGRPDVPDTDTDVYLYEGLTRNVTPIFTGPGQQRFADISTGFIAATDFSEDPDGYFGSATACTKNEQCASNKCDPSNGMCTDLADIVLYERATAKITKRSAPGKQAFPILVNDSVLGYLDWRLVHPEPKLEAYELRSGDIRGVDANDKTIANIRHFTSSPTRPSVASGMFEWVANPTGKTGLYRAPIDGSAEPVQVSGLDDLELYAPASTKGYTVLATTQRNVSAPTPQLRAVTR